MSDITKFVNACRDNNVSRVRQMLSAGMDVNARNIDGWPGLYLAMYHNRKETVAVLLACSDIRLDITNSCNGMTGLHTACKHNSVQCVRLFLGHPDCTKQCLVHAYSDNGG